MDTLWIAVYLLFLWGFGSFRSLRSLVTALFFTGVAVSVLYAGSFAYEGKTTLALITFVSPFAVAWLAALLIPARTR